MEFFGGVFGLYYEKFWLKDDEMTTFTVCAILLPIICIIEWYFVAARYEKLKQKTTMRQIFHKDMQFLLKWIADNWFKLAIIILFMMLVCVLQTELSGIKSELHNIYRYM